MTLNKKTPEFPCLSSTGPDWPVLGSDPQQNPDGFAIGYGECQ
jgi:hypothetical protein